MTNHGREMLEQVVGGAKNITLKMEDCVTVAEINIHRDGVRLIRSDEVEDALEKAGIEIPKEIAAPEESTEDDMLKMPEPVNWAEIEEGTIVEFRDDEGEIVVGWFAKINEDGSLAITVRVGDDTSEARVIPDNVRLVVDGPRVLQGLGEFADAVGLSADQGSIEKPTPGPTSPPQAAASGL